MLIRYPRTVRVSEKTWQVEKKISVESVKTKIIFSKQNSFMHMFNVSTLYQQSIKLLHQKL